MGLGRRTSKTGGSGGAMRRLSPNGKASPGILCLEPWEALTAHRCPPRDTPHTRLFGDLEDVDRTAAVAEKL